MDTTDTTDTTLSRPARDQAPPSGLSGPAPEFRPDIQALRAIAVGLVVIYHAGVPFVSGGYIGVDVFFVISGFLITQHLIGSMQRGTFGFGSFYVKRARRILPAALTVVVLTCLIAWAVVPKLELQRILEDAVATALYVPNVFFWIQGTDYLSATEPSVFQHYWSLGIEEQFYLVWPVLIYLVYRFTRGNPLALKLSVSSVVLVSFVACVIMTQRDQPFAFFLLPTRAWELGVGGLLALGVFGTANALNWRLRRTLGILGLAVLVGCALLYTDATPFPSFWAAVPVATTMLVIWAGPFEGRLDAAMQLRGVQWLGTVSYSVYLVHWPLLVLPLAASGWYTTLPLWANLGLALASLPIAWLSYRFVETPLRHPRRGSRPGLRRPAIVAIAASVLIAVLAFTGSRFAATAPVDSGDEVRAFQPTDQPQGTPVVGSNLSVPLSEASKDIAKPSGQDCHLGVGETVPPGCTYGDAEGVPHIVLAGDSHAGQWSPALEGMAEDGLITLTTHTKDGCPIFDKTVTGELTEAEDCGIWRGHVEEALAADPPDAILLSTSINEGVRKHVGAYEAGLRDGVAGMPEASEVVLLMDTPRFPADPLLCLSGNVESPDDCARARDEAVLPSFVEADQRVAEEFGAHRIDLTDYMCSDVCYAIQDSMLVFKDLHHISRSFSLAMQPVLEEKMRDLDLLD